MPLSREEIKRLADLASDLGNGYVAHQAALEISRNPRSDALLPPVEPGQLVPVIRIKQGDGVGRNSWEWHFPALLDAGRQPARAEYLDRVYFTGALITFADALDRVDYVDRAPELEFVRHLRNGVAHGNRFDIRYPDKLTKYPAHTRWVLGHIDPPPDWLEITPALNGRPVLFEFIGAVSLVRLFLGIAVYFSRMAEGVPLREAHWALG